MNISSSTSWSDPRGVQRAGMEPSKAQGRATIAPEEAGAGPRAAAGIDPEPGVQEGALSASEAAELSLTVARTISENWGAALAAGAGPNLRPNPGLLEAS